MKCKDCGTSLSQGELLMECKACACFTWDCDCKRRLGYQPKRIVHCKACDEFHKAEVDTTKAGWRSLEV